MKPLCFSSCDPLLRKHPMPIKDNFVKVVDLRECKGGGVQNNYTSLFFDDLITYRERCELMQLWSLRVTQQVFTESLLCGY